VQGSTTGLVTEITGTINDCARVNEVHTFYKFTF